MCSFRKANSKSGTGCRRMTGAYMSLEASMVLPLVLFLILEFVLVSLFMYGREGLEADSYLLLFRESIRKDRKDALAGITGGYEAQAAGKYPSLETPSFSVSGGEKMTLQVRARSAGRAFSLTETAWKYDPPASIRTFRRVREVADKIKERFNSE